MSTPNFIGAILIKPLLDAPDVMIRDDEVERIGVRYVMQYEKEKLRIPEDVSSQNLGYDIKFIDKDNNVRYIEVKTRAKSGDIALTTNEWFKAQRFGDYYYLYVVYDAAKEPKLSIIQNPCKNLNPTKEYISVRFIIDENQINNKGVKT